MQLTQPLRKALRECPDEIAVVCGERRHTHREFVARVARFAAVLQRLGVGPGDRVGMLALNSDRYLEYVYGTLWAGAVINPVNIRWSAAEIAYSLDDCQTRVLLVDDTFLPLVPALRASSRVLSTLIHVGDGAPPAGLLGYEVQLASQEPTDDAQRGDADLAAVLYTGGTTGKSKGVMLSHDNLALCALASIAATPRRARAIGLHVAPLFHVGGLSFALQLALRQSRQVVLPSFEPAAALQAIERERASECFLVPTMIRLLLDHADFAHRDVSSLDTLIYGASPIAPALLRDALRLLPQARFVQAYGQTEAAPVVAMLASEFHVADGNKLAAAGRPLAITELRIEDADGREVPQGEVGEICVRGPTVMQGYWSQPEQTAVALRGGWLHSGDAGYVDTDGFLFVVDRFKDMIISGGENVYSVEVEAALMQHAAVSMCAVIGLPDAVWGETVHAVVVRKPGMDVDAAGLIAHCQQGIARYKAPRSVEFRESLPMSGAGKILKFELRPKR